LFKYILLFRYLFIIIAFVGLGKAFMPEPYQTRMRENVQVERLQTDEKG
jgi:hypothetical protein